MEEFHGHNTMEYAMMEHAAMKRVPINGSLELLPLCNMNCDMCYVRLSRKEMESQGSLCSGAQWLAIGRELARAGTLFLLLTGGEPLLHPDFKEIYLGLKKMGMILTVNTNATLINEEWADFFGKYKPRRINITLYGVNDATYETLCHHPGGYTKAVHAVQLLRQRNVDVRLGFSVVAANRKDLPEMFDLARKLEVPMIADTYMNPSVRERTKPFDRQSRMLPEEAARAHLETMRLEHGAENIDDAIRKSIAQIDSFVAEQEEPCAGTCMAGRCSFAINWQGKLRPCVMASMPEADVFQLGFETAWRNVTAEYADLRFCSQCSVCALRSVCPVCPVACKAETGDYMGKPEYLCRYARETERLLRRSLEEQP